jgi:hypothetical protein
VSVARLERTGTDRPSSNEGFLLEEIIPEGFEVRDFDRSIKLYDPTGEFNPEALGELLGLSSDYKQGELSFVFDGYESHRELMINKHGSRIVEDSFVLKKGSKREGRRTRFRTFREQSLQKPGSNGVDCYVFIKPEAKGRVTAKKAEQAKKAEEARKKSEASLRLVGGTALIQN